MYGVKYKRKVLVYIFLSDAIKTFHKLENGFTKFGWNKEEIQPPFTVVKLNKYKGYIVKDGDQDVFSRYTHE